MTTKHAQICNQCDEIHIYPKIDRVFIQKLTIQKESKGDGWYAAVYDDLHFCNKECLKKWIDEVL